MRKINYALGESRNYGAIILGLFLIGLVSSLHSVYHITNTAFAQTDDELVVDSKFASNTTNFSEGASDETLMSQQPSSSFVTKGTINSVISVPAGKWLAVGNWSMTLNNDNVTLFDTSMTWYNSSGTNAHTHALTNFRPTATEKTVLLDQKTNNIIIKGVTDVGTNDKISWSEIPTSIVINGHKIVSISVDDNKTNHHFGGQPILGVISSFVPCSDLPGPNMEVLPPCTVSTLVEDSFNYTNNSQIYSPSEDLIPYQGDASTGGSFPPEENLGIQSNVPLEDGQGTGGSFPSEDAQGTGGSFPSEDAQGTGGSFPSEDAQGTGGSFPSEDAQGTGGSFPSENSPQCAELEIKNISSSGFEDNPSDYHPPFDAVDGDSSTWWSNQDENSWLQIDLGKARLLCGLSVEWNKGDTREYSFVIEVSDDGNEFKKVFEGSNKVGSAREAYPIKDIEGQFVKLGITGSSSDKGWVSVKEIKVNGRPIA